MPRSWKHRSGNDTGCLASYYKGHMMKKYKSVETPGRGVVRDPPVDLSDIESRENGVYRIGLASFSSCTLYLVSCILHPDITYTV
jgi:hypothetical protein